MIEHGFAGAVAGGMRLSSCASRMLAASWHSRHGLPQLHFHAHKFCLACLFGDITTQTVRQLR